MDRPRLIRRLRIAVTMLCLTACVLLIVLWVRSYSWFDSFSVSFDGRRAHWMGSIGGEIRYGKPVTPKAHGLQWKTYDTPTKEWLLSEHPRRSVLGFRWDHSSRGPYACPIIPHWFPVLITATFTATPWIKWRFSLRTMLIAMTLIAVGLAIFATAT